MAESRFKRQKTSDADKANPYLAHMHDNDGAADSNSYGNGYSNGGSSILDTFKRHATTHKDAMKAEDGPKNPFNGNQLSDRYFSILKTRRDLPVHQQRAEFLELYQKSQILVFVGETGSGKTGAFALPILQALLENPQRYFALVLTPTRELAFQISEQFEALGKVFFSLIQNLWYDIMYLLDVDYDSNFDRCWYRCQVCCHCGWNGYDGPVFNACQEASYFDCYSWTTRRPFRKHKRV